MPPTENKSDTLYLGITMAGAVSAGAYTAGVMDYLLETLHAWNELKKTGADHIPQHHVQIDALGGASAGGITAALSLLALYKGLAPIRHPEEGLSADNLLYDAWVNLADRLLPDGTYSNETFKSMLATDDIKPGRGVPALLNSTPIDHIAERALRVKPGSLPEFVANDLEVILSLFSLRGLRREVPFVSGRTTDDPGHPFYLHKLYAHFKLLNQEANHLPFDIRQPGDVQRLIHLAKATAAFPIGLQSRNIDDFSSTYLLQSVNRFVPMENAEGHEEQGPFKFTAVDGGTANNEPFGEIAQILTRRHPGLERNLAVLLIDPFPSFNFEEAAVTQQNHLLQIIPALINALRQQVMVKEADVVRREYAHLSLNMIWPKRYDQKLNNLSNPIACGALGGFSGFFDRSFREHDFFLGRENCRRFLRFFFIREYPLGSVTTHHDWHPVHQTWTLAMVNAFKQELPRKGVIRLPLIPDPFWMNKDNKFYDQYLRLASPPFPSIPASQILAFKKDLDKRIEAILKNIQNVSSAPGDVPSALDRAVEKYLQKELSGNWFQSSVKWLGQKFAGILMPGDVGKIIDKFYGHTLTRKALSYIIHDLARHGLLSDDPFRPKEK